MRSSCIGPLKRQLLHQFVNNVCGSIRARNHRLVLYQDARISLVFRDARVNHVMDITSSPDTFPLAWWCTHSAPGGDVIVMFERDS